ncbi:Zinc finger, CCHC-type [Corchorus capsularis]|uniref:Zinc finger, CCHC-type n=1 Tax=Corchorus capsularis TaxID=210143 RepID=A0A1R3JX91_COCAP|nr:Zinc finger, CCHC-type [Corchorus capsularis]
MSVIDESSGSLSSGDDEEVDMLTKKFKRFMRSNRQGRKSYKKDQNSSWKGKNKHESYKGDKILCYKCKKSGHYKYECPLLKEGHSRKDKRQKKKMEQTKIEYHTQRQA